MTSLENYIHDQVAILSGDLANYIVKTEKIPNASARKRIQRLKSPIHKLKGLFSERQSLIYHADYFNQESFFQKLEEAFEKAGKRYMCVLNAISYNEGVISREDLANFTFSPLSNIKGHMRYSTLIQKLQNVNVLLPLYEDYYQLNPHILSSSDERITRYRAVKFSSDLVISQFMIWCRNIGLNSFNKGERNSIVSGFQFAYTAPTYVNGFVRYNKGKPIPGFIVADVLIGKKVEAQHIDFFIQKIKIIQASNKFIRLFPILIVDSTEVKALQELKSNGVVVATVKELFGEEYSELLKSLINTITNAGVILKKNPENYLNLMEQLTKLVEGKTNNLRGDLFELAVGYYHGKYCQFLEIGKRIIVSGMGSREIDVLAIYEEEVKVVECKGYHYPVNKTYITDQYLTNNIQIIRTWLLEKFPNKKHSFEIWSTGGFEPEAEEILRKAKENTKKYDIDYFDKNTILEKAGKLNTSKFTKILKDYFLKDIA